MGGGGKKREGKKRKSPPRARSRPRFFRFEPQHARTDERLTHISTEVLLELLHHSIPASLLAPGRYMRLHRERASERADERGFVPFAVTAANQNITMLQACRYRRGIKEKDRKSQSCCQTQGSPAIAIRTRGMPAKLKSPYEASRPSCPQPRHVVRLIHTMSKYHFRFLICRPARRISPQDSLSCANYRATASRRLRCSHLDDAPCSHPLRSFALVILDMLRKK